MYEMVIIETTLLSPSKFIKIKIDDDFTVKSTSGKLDNSDVQERVLEVFNDTLSKYGEWAMVSEDYYEDGHVSKTYTGTFKSWLPLVLDIHEEISFNLVAGAKYDNMHRGYAYEVYIKKFK